jgi:tripartite-type tricarboxylate transporter receptor subunit TctC
LEKFMKLPRRIFLQLAAGAAALPTVSRGAWAQTYPERPVHLIVFFAPGGGNDIVARLMGQWLSGRLGQQFVIENRPGGGGNIGTEDVVRAAPDGYTLLLSSSPNAVNATLYDKLNFDFIRDIAPVAGISREPNVMVVNPLLPVKTVPEFIAYAKANPGKVNYATAGIGSSQHMSGELFKIMAGIDMVHVPHRGSAPALTSLLGGEVQVMFASMPSSLAFIQADIGAPRNTPPEIVDRLNREINAGLDDLKLKARLVELGGTPLPGSPAEFGALIKDETEKWAKVIKSGNIKAE